MRLIKKIVRGLATFSFGLLLLLAAGGFNWLGTLGRPATVKSWPSDSGLYQRAPDAFLAELSKKPEDSGGLPLKDPEVQAAVKTAFSPPEIQKLTENFIDSLYRWLEGKVAAPDFRLDLTGARDKFIASLSDYGKRRLTALPACSRRNLPPPDTDIFSLECLPPRTNIDAAVAKWAEQIKSNEQLADPVITLKDLKEGENSFKNLESLPGLYQAMRWLPWVLGALALLSGAAMIWLNNDKRLAWRRVARSVLVAGLILLFSGVAGRAIAGSLGKTSADKKDPLNTLGLPLIKTAAADVTRGQLWFGGVYTLGGLATYLWLKKTRPKNPK